MDPGAVKILAASSSFQLKRGTFVSFVGWWNSEQDWQQLHDRPGILGLLCPVQKSGAAVSNFL